MRIGVDLRSLQTGSQYRGIGYFTYNLQKAVSEIDKENEYIFFANEFGPGERYPLLERLVSETGHRLVALPVTHARDREWGRTWERLSTPFFFRLERMDILHVTSLFEDATPVGFYPFGGKLAVTLYDLIPLIFRADYLDGAPEWKSEYMSLVDLVREHADGVLAISKCTRDDAVKLMGLPPGKISVVYGATGDTFSLIEDGARVAELKKRLGVKGDYILFAAAEDFRKNFENLLKAYAILRKEYGGTAQLVMVGKSSPDWRRRLTDLGVSFGLEGGDMVFTGFVTDEEMNLLYNGASVFAFPSLYEGFGLPVLEAMLCGVPVVVSSNSSLMEVAGDAALLVDPLDPRDMAEKMNMALADSALREDLRMRGFLNVKRFSWRKAAEETVNFYRSLSENA